MTEPARARLEEEGAYLPLGGRDGGLRVAAQAATLISQGGLQYIELQVINYNHIIVNNNILLIAKMK